MLFYSWWFADYCLSIFIYDILLKSLYAVNGKIPQGEHSIVFYAILFYAILLCGLLCSPLFTGWRQPSVLTYLGMTDSHSEPRAPLFARHLGRSLTCIWVAPAPPRTGSWGTDPGRPCSPPEPATGPSASASTCRAKQRWPDLDKTNRDVWFIYFLAEFKACFFMFFYLAAELLLRSLISIWDGPYEITRDPPRAATCFEISHTLSFVSLIVPFF